MSAGQGLALIKDVTPQIAGPITKAEAARRAYANAQSLGRDVAFDFIGKLNEAANEAAELAALDGAPVGIRERARVMAIRLREDAQAVEAMLNRGGS